MKCRDSKCSLTYALAIIGAIAAAAGIAVLVVKFLMKSKDRYCDCYHCECDDSDEDDFEDDDDDFVDDDDEDESDESAAEESTDI
jgi:hypothetical protein